MSAVHLSTNEQLKCAIWSKYLNVNSSLFVGKLYFIFRKKHTLVSNYHWQHCIPA